jgi:glucans biosynthesis protein
LKLYVIEFAGGDLEGDITADVTASSGEISQVHLQKNSVEKTTRLSFEHNVNGADISEIRAVLKRGDKKASETWLFRWTRS